MVPKARGAKGEDRQNKNGGVICKALPTSERLMRLLPAPAAPASNAKATSQPASLNQKLTQLQNEGCAVAGLYRNANRTFYKHVVELYMWWRDAEQVDGYLDQAYSLSGKKYKTKVTHGINFAPLFWLTWGLDNGLTDDKANRCSRVLNKLHDLYLLVKAQSQGCRTATHC